jgi:hypothetical protein
MKKKLMPGIINPFSENFLDTWDIWKQYRKEQHSFQYRGCLSEQAALMELNRLSESNEEMAKEIIMQSITNTWKGFFPIKDKINGAKTIGQQQAVRDSVQDEFNKRNYAGRQTAN